MTRSFNFFTSSPCSVSFPCACCFGVDDCCLSVASSSHDNALSLSAFEESSFLASASEFFVSSSSALVFCSSSVILLNSPRNFSNAATSVAFPSITSSSRNISSLYFFSMLCTFFIGELACMLDDNKATLFSDSPKSALSFSFADIRFCISSLVWFNFLSTSAFVSLNVLFFCSTSFSKSSYFCSLLLDFFNSSAFALTMSFSCFTCSFSCSFSSTKLVPNLPARFNASSLFLDIFSCFSNFSLRARVWVCNCLYLLTTSLSFFNN